MRSVALWAIVASVVVAASVNAQPLQRPAGACMGRHSLDPAQIETVSGRIASIASHAGTRGGGGTHATVETSSGVVDVMLGPSAFLDAQSMQLAKGDQVELRGWRIQSPRWGEHFIARTVQRGADVLELRDDHGLPAWAPGAVKGFGGPTDELCPCGGQNYR